MQRRTSCDEAVLKVNRNFYFLLHEKINYTLKIIACRVLTRNKRC